MKNGATQEGVPDPRAAIATKVEEDRLSEMKAEGAEAPGTPEDWEEDEGATTQQEEAKEETPEETAEETQPTAEVAQPPVEQMLRVKVDGVEMEKPLSWVLAQAQKNAAADRRLEEASKAKTLYEQRLAELESLRPKEPEKPKKPSLPADLADALKGLARRQLETSRRSRKPTQSSSGRVLPSTSLTRWARRTPISVTWLGRTTSRRGSASRPRWCGGRGISRSTPATVSRS
jgi:hypothetical protein